MARDKCSGIYKITNKINGKVYIGLSGDIPTRWREHKCHYKFIDNILYRAMRKYGIENFKFEILEYCSLDELSDKEKFYIRQYNSYTGWKNNNGYNATLGGETSQGAVFSQEVKNKMSESHSLGKNSASKKVYVDDKIFNCIKEAAQYLKLSPCQLRRWLRKERNIPMDKIDLLKHKIGYVGDSPLSEENLSHHTRVKCDSIVFNSVKECSEYLGIDSSMLIQYLKGQIIASKFLKNRELQYIDKETSIKFKKDIEYRKYYIFYCDNQEFTATELSTYLHGSVSTIYYLARNSTNNKFVYKNKNVTIKERDGYNR